MPGLDPGIHGMPLARTPDIRAGCTAWMAGSSPAMTVFGLTDDFQTNIAAVAGAVSR
jgi:hypothetical protein